MKHFNKTLLAAALAVAAAGTGVAEASIATSSSNGAAGGEFVFNLVDYTAQTSYTLDLGITTSAFLTNVNQQFNFSSILSADSNFASFASSYAAGHNVAWGIAGSQGKLSAVADRANWGFFTTSTVAAPAAKDSSIIDVNNTQSKHNTMVGMINTVDDVSNNYSAFRSVAVNGPNSTTGVMDNDFQTALPFTGQGAVSAGTLSSLFFVREGLLNMTGTTTTTLLTTYANTWNFAFNGSAATLTYAPAVSAVPLPAAVWMFGAGLMGVLRLNRRKSMAA